MSRDAFDRDLVSIFDALLVVVLALVLYGMSARDPSELRGWMDRIQLVAVAVVSALVLDVMVLGAMIARIGDLGFTPNRTAALGLNLVRLRDPGQCPCQSRAKGRQYHRRVQFRLVYEGRLPANGDRRAKQA